MSRKPKKGYFVKGHFVAEGSELDLELRAEQTGGEPSKTELKKESTDLQKLGEALLTLRGDLYEKLPLPENLRDALAELRRITNFEGRRRQLQYVGKLMRGLDEEVLQNPTGRPIDADAAARVKEPARIYQDCSGNHAGILVASAYAGWPLDSYRTRSHPHHRRLFR